VDSGLHQLAERPIDHALPFDTALAREGRAFDAQAEVALARRVITAMTPMLLEKDKSWFEARMPILDERVRARLGQLSAALGNSNWLDGEFSAGDLLMVNVLRRPAASPILQEFPNLVAYVARGEARPAFKRAFEAQHAVFLASSAA
jgi:glutathione S-transferase